VVAVSPIVGRDSVKGPLGKILRELGEAPASATVVRHYRGLLDGLVLDRRDEGDASAIPVATHVTETLMRSLDDREALAREALGFADNLRAAAEFPNARRAGAAR
jgi:LPPG:FO 2-phospho-L-lactate transferase